MVNNYIKSLIIFLFLIIVGTIFLARPSASQNKDAKNHYHADVVVYGGTSGAVIAAVQAARMDKSVIMVSPDKHLGGLSSGGLGWTDIGNKAVIGGLSREFYHRIWQHYQEPSAWKWQEHAEYGIRKGRGRLDSDANGKKTMWIFEPHVAEKVFDNMVFEHNVTVLRDEWLDRKNGVSMNGGRITSIETLSGKTFHGAMFIDGTYEGDLMAAAGVDYHVGREANSVYDEKWNGVQIGVLHHKHYFPPDAPKVDPYYAPGEPSSGIMPRVSTDPPGEKGSGDKKIQAYNFRMCLSSHPDNQIPFPMPENYDSSQYLGLLRLFETGWHKRQNFFQKFDPIPNHKTDTNNHGPFSTDNIGMNYDYPEGSYAKRREIIKEHEIYQKGLMYFLANDPRVPDTIQTEINKWGLAKDEFQDNGHWPHQLYIREARRMQGSYVMTEHEVLGRRDVPKSVGMGAYGMDSHNVQRYITPEGYVQNEGDIGVRTPTYQISYGALIPKKGQAQNLLVPLAVSASHIAFGSIRMEPVFMILGQSAGTAAALSIDNDVAVQNLDYQKLRERLLSDGQVLQYEDSE